jgi:hypothetical protein
LFKEAVEGLAFASEIVKAIRGIHLILEGAGEEFSFLFVGEDLLVGFGKGFFEGVKLKVAGAFEVAKGGAFLAAFFVEFFEGERKVFFIEGGLEEGASFASFFALSAVLAFDGKLCILVRFQAFAVVLAFGHRVEGEEGKLDLIEALDGFGFGFCDLLASGDGRHPSFA